jgi:hypothetical protein
MCLGIKSKRQVHVDVEYKARVAKDELSTAIRVHVMVLCTEDGGCLLLRRDRSHLLV